jgi:hypothetical protein
MVEGPVVVKPEVIRVDKATYNTIRSFVESSTKPIYSANVGVIKGNFVAFKKPGKWELDITLMVQQTPVKRVVLCARNVYVAINIEPGFKVIGLTDKPLWVRDVNEAKKYEVIPDQKVPCARPISLAEFLEKIMMYVDAAVDAFTDFLATKFYN